MEKEQAKTELLRMATAGEDRPAPDTELGQWLAALTTPPTMTVSMDSPVGANLSGEPLFDVQLTENRITLLHPDGSVHSYFGIDLKKIIQKEIDKSNRREAKLYE